MTLINDSNLEPSLPYELERLIFEYAARKYRSVIPSLLRVASRVKQWIEPLRLLYEIVIFDQPPYYHPNHETLSNHSNSVRHLLLRDTMPHRVACDYLHACGNLLTLSFVADDLAAQPTPPRGLSYTTFKTQFPNVFPAYQHLTHLELLTTSSPLRRIGWLTNLPTLTHLFILSPMMYINESAKQIFARCPQMRMMLWCPWTGQFRDDKGEPTGLQIHAIQLPKIEPRLVICKVGYKQFTKQFLAHAEGKWDSENIWKLAEEVIKKRLETGITNYADIVDYTTS